MNEKNNLHAEYYANNNSNVSQNKEWSTNIYINNNNTNNNNLFVSNSQIQATNNQPILSVNLMKS